MSKIVWRFGVIAGAILMAVMTGITIPFLEAIGDWGEVVGYSSMVLAFLMVYVGIRTYRDTLLAGAIGFGRAFKAGILIALIASSCYVATWEVIYYTMMPDFMEKYSERVIEKARAGGATEAQLETQKAAMAKMGEAYKNPLVNVGMTFLEVFPVGLVMTLVSAGILTRKRSV